LIEWLKAYATGVGWAVGIVVSIAGVILAVWKILIEQKRLRLDERKLKNEEMTQKRKEWKAQKHIYDAASKICEEGAYFCEPLEVVQSFQNLCLEARTIVPKNIFNYLLEINIRAFKAHAFINLLRYYQKKPAGFRLGSKDIQELEGDVQKDIKEIDDWFDLENGTDSVNRPIDKKFYPHTGLE